MLVEIFENEELDGQSDAYSSSTEEASDGQSPVNFESNEVALIVNKIGKNDTNPMIFSTFG